MKHDMAEPDLNAKLLDAAIQGDLLTLLKALEMGADIDTLHPESRASPLIFTAGNGHVDCVAALLRAGANIETSNLNDYTALMAAVERGWPKVVALLLQNGADWSDDWGVILMEGSSEERAEIEALLLARREKHELENLI